MMSEIKRAMDRTSLYYSAPSYNFRGAGFPVYAGSRRQRGGNILGALRSFVAPILNSLKRKAINESFGLAKGVMLDAVTGKNVKQSLINRGKKSVRNLGTSVAKDALQSVSKNFIPTGSQRRTVKKRRATRPPTGSKQRLAKKRRTVNNF